MVFTKAELDCYFEKSERIDLLRGRIESLLKRIMNELEVGKFLSIKPQNFGNFPIPGTSYTLEIFSVEMRRGDFCKNIIRIVGQGMRPRTYVHGHNSIPVELVGPVYRALPVVMSHFCELWPDFALDMRVIMSSVF
jgi:hypothetical protein